jgi:C-terminal processing protease CtpA/Prc
MKRSDKLEAYRSLKIDSAQKAAYLTLNTFSKGHLRKFFRRSFRTLRKKNITELAIDIRNNGGGRVGLSTLLTRYLSRKPFKVADSLYAKTQSLHPYTKYIKGRFLNNLEMMLISSRQKDGNYHIRHLERKTYSPKKKNHYNGNLYLLVSGPSFSATTLVANTLKGQVKIVLLGEETGGGWHGNNGIMIPDIILPLTKMRVRLPLYRLVQYEHVPKNGMGIIPDIYIGTSYEALLKGYDQKQRVAMQLMHWQGAIR